MGSIKASLENQQCICTVLGLQYGYHSLWPEGALIFSNMTAQAITHNFFVKFYGNPSHRIEANRIQILSVHAHYEKLRNRDEEISPSATGAQLRVQQLRRLSRTSRVTKTLLMGPTKLEEKQQSINAEKNSNQDSRLLGESYAIFLGHCHCPGHTSMNFGIVFSNLKMNSYFIFICAHKLCIRRLHFSNGFLLKLDF